MLKNLFFSVIAAVACVGCSQSSEPKTLEAPEFDGLYAVYEDNSTIEIRPIKVTHKNPSYVVGGGYCNPSYSSAVTKVPSVNLKGFIIQDSQAEVFKYIYRGTKGGCADVENRYEVRQKSLGQNSYYFEPRMEVKSDVLYTVWVDKTLWFFILE